ncbi:type 1 glutamine amidotransferase [Oryzomonas japonica]|uniref:Type 1 glutamine amidotransferase n=1 Tax=Oryzomonas japonica TaxID=2603858 RepID=A0A7J4ZQJ5_9BACT|nr:type 1 glutamine amidotransferase [Oryzomonas japonica]KAB0665089.1 type 1 glutamine amidotransferase [Oryzomonas japonica]
MFHIIQNDPEVPPGNITRHLRHLDAPVTVCHAYRNEPLPAPEETQGVIVLGGAMCANDDQRHPFLTQVKGFIREMVAHRTPYLGICLGGQLLAAAMGGQVVANRWEELGTLEVELTAAGREDRLFTGCAPRLGTFQWHHDSFDIPPGAVLLAASPACPHQAFRIGPYAWGTQFHPEVTEEIIRAWCAWDPATRGRADELVAGWRSEANYDATARRLLENFVGAA